MKPPRVILPLLLSALWLLVASASCPGEPINNFSGQHVPCTVFAPAHCNHHTPCCGNSLQQAAKRWGRRLNMSSGFDGLRLVAPGADFEIPLLDQTTGALHHSPPLALAQSWQFRWRTASKPRAPSH